MSSWRKPSFAEGNLTQDLYTRAAPNPLVMAPFVVGDFIQYSGFRNGAGEIVCYSIVATNIQITTKGTPAYIRVEEAQIGISGNTAVSAVGDTRVRHRDPAQPRHKT